MAQQGEGGGGGAELIHRLEQVQRPQRKKKKYIYQLSIHVNIKTVECR